MRSRFRRTLLLGVSVVLTAASIGAGTGARAAGGEVGGGSSARSAAIARATAYIHAHPASAGFGPHQALQVRDVIMDADGARHVRFDRRAHGLRVIGGDFVVHLDSSGHFRGVTRASFANPGAVRIRPLLTPRRAATTAIRAAAPRPARARNARLVVDARDSAALAWEVTVAGIRADRTPFRLHVLVDARTGTVRGSWDAVETDSAAGSGVGFFNGTVPLTTQTGSGGFELVDPSRGGQYTVDKHNSRRGSSTLFTDPDNLWGDGTLANRQTVAVDAQYGTAQTWDYYKNIHGRNGIRDNGVGAYNRVHYGTNYNNAFWKDSCFCMTYGDGDGVEFNPFDSLDVAGHEMSHGVTSATAKLLYAGESGGLNEATSDIFGTMVEFYANNPNDPPDYYIGEELYKSGPNALRAMHNPSLDGNSPNCWSPTVGTLDVHYSSGVANHFYYLLAEGSAATPASPTCNGATVVGIGRTDAERIWYRALTVYMVSTTDYHKARGATLKAARDLFGNPSSELSATNDAWAAVNLP